MARAYISEGTSLSPARIPNYRSGSTIIPPSSAVRFGIGQTEFAAVNENGRSTLFCPDIGKSSLIFRGISGVPAFSLHLDGYNRSLDRFWYVLNNFGGGPLSLKIQEDKSYLKSSSSMMAHFRESWAREDEEDGDSRMSVKKIGTGHTILPGWYSSARAGRVRFDPNSLITIHTAKDSEIFYIDRSDTKNPSYSLIYTGGNLRAFTVKQPGALPLQKNEPYVIGPGSPNDLSALFGRYPDLEMAPLSFCLTYEGEDSFLIECIEEKMITVSKTYTASHLNDREIRTGAEENAWLLTRINPSREASGALHDFIGLIVDPNGKFIGSDDPLVGRDDLEDYAFSLALRCDIRWEDGPYGKSPACYFLDDSGVYATNPEGGLYLPEDLLKVVHGSAVRYQQIIRREILQMAELWKGQFIS